MTYKEEFDLYHYYRLGSFFQMMGLSQLAYRCFRISTLYYANVEFRTRDYMDEELGKFGDKLSKRRKDCFLSIPRSASLKLVEEEIKYKTKNSFFVGYSIDWHDIFNMEK